jgi:hypothetical protein
MANKLSAADVIKPVPAGISWTAPPKGRPWSNPPKFVDVSDVAQQYIDKLSSSDIVNNVLDAIETKVPLASLAEALMLSGVNAGAHSLDTGILVMPVIIEMLKTAAELHNTDYIVFAEEATEGDAVPERVIRQAIKEAAEKKDSSDEAVAPQVELSGLMSRKPKTEIA